MSYTLGGSTIKSPQTIKETNSTMYAQQRTLSGAINRDFFGSKKRVWVLTYRNVQPSAYTTIKTVRDTYESTGSTQAFVSTETNYAISSTSVHIDLQERSFSVRGSDYISDFDLILTEA